MKVIKRSKIDADLWDAVYRGSDEAWLFHASSWIDIECRFHAKQELSFAVMDENGKIVAIQPLFLREVALGQFIEIILDCGFHRHTGLSIINGIPEKKRAAIRKTAMRQIFELADKFDVDRIQLNTQNLAPVNLNARREEIPFWVKDYGFYLGLHYHQLGCLPIPGMSTCCADQIVALENTNEGELFQRLTDSCRRAVKKAQRNNLLAVIEKGISTVDEYLRIAQFSAKRTGESLPPRDYYDSIFEKFHSGGKCQIVFAEHKGQRVGGLIFLVDKGSVNFLASASHTDALPMRVNDFLHWEVIRWALKRRYHYYRLGPFFPELPRDWPVYKVSYFKKKFGTKSIPIIEGSFFRKPEKYLASGIRELTTLCKRNNVISSPKVKSNLKTKSSPQKKINSLAMAMRHYGLIDAPLYEYISLGKIGKTQKIAIVITPDDLNVPGVECISESEGCLYYPAKKQILKRKIKPVYHALLPHIAFDGNNLEPLWINENGRAVAARIRRNNKEILLLGLNVEEEIVRYHQGDPKMESNVTDRAKYGFEFERPNYLFENQIHPDYPSVPWADRLGFFVCENIAQIIKFPLIEPLPRGARGAIILTGDDDQAFLEKYERQLKVIEQLPITYFLVPQTKHTSETLSRLPSNVEIGLHPDALDHPEEYDSLCVDQTKQIRQLSGRKIRTLRNHGFLNNGYLGHLRTWEKNELKLDVNYPGVDGTALNGSFLPMRVRRPDGSWSEHYSLLTSFGDGIIYAQNFSQRHAIKRIRKLIRQIERDKPGVIVFNFHPQNIDDTTKLHREVLAHSQRRGWIALGLESYLDWLETLERIKIKKVDNRIILTSPVTVSDLVLRIPTDGSWRRMPLAPWAGEKEIVVS